MAKSNMKICTTAITNVKLGVNDVVLYLGTTKIYPLSIPITGATVTCDSASYTGSTQVAQNIVVTLNGTTLVENTDYTVTQNSGGTNAGTYTVVVTGINNYEGTASGSFVINKVAATLPGTISGDRKDIHNTPARATVSTDYTGGTLQYSTDSGTSWSDVTWYSGNLTANPSNSTIGDVNVMFRVNPDSNHTVVTSSAITLTVIKATDSSVTVTASSTLTYTGSAQTIATASNEHGTSAYYIGYKAGSQATADNLVTWNAANTTPLKATNAGDYYIYYKFTVDSQHSGDKAYTYVGKVTINKADQAAPTATGATTSYPTTATASASGGGGQGSLEWESAQSQTSVGSHTTRARWAGNSNYNASPWSSYVTVQMNKANQAAPTAYGATTTYNTTATATASGGGGLGSIEWSNGNTQTTVGSKTTYARWSGNANYNASPWSNAATITMNKATGSVTTVPVNTNYTYNGTARVVASNGAGTGTMYYRLGASGSFSTTMPTMTNAGSNTLYYYAAASTNYTQSATGSITVSVLKASQTAPTAYGATVDYGSTATATASGGGGQGSIEWSNGNTRTAVGSQTTYARWSGNTNYNASGWSNAATLTVSQTIAGHEFVDLGLPSGTKWATMNVGASSIYDYGNFYMYGKGTRTFTLGDAAYAGAENPLSLDVDTARLAWGSTWHMPTKDQCLEIVDNCTSTEFVYNNKIYVKITGPNGNYFVVPYCGYRYWYDGEIKDLGAEADFWSSTPDRPGTNSYGLHFLNGISMDMYTSMSNNGYNIRPVVG